MENEKAANKRLIFINIYNSSEKLWLVVTAFHILLNRRVAIFLAHARRCFVKNRVIT